MNIYLTGYRGTGKTTLGKRLSKKLGMDFVDMDRMIEKKEKRSIEEIFFTSGEKYFREVEHRVLCELAERTNLIVSTGGGVVLLPENRKIIRSTGIVIYLTADEKTIYERIKDDKNRPPLTPKPLQEEIKSLLATREPLYEELADITLDTSLYNIKECIEKITEFLKKKGMVI
ncbi:MAG: shikimate kinase [Brevinematia bacterium]